MKKFLLIVLLVVCTLTLFVACTPEDTEQTPSHQHSFTNKVNTIGHLKQSAGCDHGSIYYYSCECGQNGTETYELDDRTSHELDVEVLNDEGLNKCVLCGCYLVNTEQDLENIDVKCMSSLGLMGEKVMLESDLTFTKPWQPICQGSRNGGEYTGTAFAGTFLGNGHKISNLTFSQYEETACGLFGVVKGTVDGLVIENSTAVCNSKEAGFIAGLLVEGGTISNCVVESSCSLTAKDGAGGIVGRILYSGHISDCINKASVTLDTTTDGGCGGIVGKAYYTDNRQMTISNCANYGNVTGCIAGGIAGLNSADTTNCTNQGKVTGYQDAGGISAQQKCCGNVGDCANSGEIILLSGAKDNDSAGGIIGAIYYTKDTSSYKRTKLICVTNCQSSGKITCSNARYGVGGIVGYVHNQCLIQGNTVTCQSIGYATATGALVGLVENNNTSTAIVGATATICNNTYSQTITMRGVNVDYELGKGQATLSGNSAL